MAVKIGKLLGSAVCESLLPSWDFLVQSKRDRGMVLILAATDGVPAVLVLAVDAHSVSHV
jgi:hypothetical protein